MAIGEFSRLCGLSARRLRSYAASGLLVPSAVDSETGYRYYQPGQARDARVIDLLRGAGVAVADIGRFLASPSLAAIEHWAEEVTAEADARLRSLDALKELLALEPIVRSDIDSEEDTTLITMTAMGATQTGRARSVNEDAYIASPTIAAVADGMGGAPAGERASADVLHALLTRAPTSVDELVVAVTAANHQLWDDARRDQELEGMGTTLCAVVPIGRRLATANVGDSRCYLLRDGELTQVTVDHTVVAELLARGELDEGEASDHPYRHVLTRAVGVAPEVEPDIVMLDPADGDRVLLCTDGLAVLSVDRIGALLIGGDPTSAAERLIAAACEDGAEDDAAVVIVDITTT